MTHLEFKPPCWVLYYNTLPQVIEQSLFLFFRIALLFEGAILKKKNGKNCSLRTYVEERPGWGRPQMGESIFPVWLTGPRDPRGAVFAKKKSSHTNYNIILFYYLGGRTKNTRPTCPSRSRRRPAAAAAAAATAAAAASHVPTFSFTSVPPPRGETEDDRRR